jgi:uncharacterized protein (TIGR02145 family)
MKIAIFYREVGLLLLIFCFGIANAQLQKGQSVRDTDGNVYGITRIGPHLWTTRNLDVSHFRNGDPIPEAKTVSDWEKAGKDGKPAWCNYDNDTANGRKNGKLYNYYAVTDPRGLAPEGLHIPSNEDWRTLTKALGTVDIAGIKLKNTTGWNKKDLADNTSGFSAIPSGLRMADGGFDQISNTAQWWSTSGVIGSSKQVYSVMVSNSHVEIMYQKVDKETGLSVRLVKD